jgi:hypothetical protein
MTVRPSQPALYRQLSVIVTRWQRLIDIVCNPYRPEHHYMRGPGPKWRAKHQGASHAGAL